MLIGNTSALETHKDYYTFIDTIKNIAAKDINVIGFIIGQGSMLPELKKYASDAGVASRIIFTGFRTDVADCLSGLDVFLMTSLTEGLGTSVLDAFAAGVPVVATRAGGIPEMVIHGVTGMLAPLQDSQTLADYILRLIHDHELKKTIVLRARDKVQEFTKENTAKKTLEVYRQVLNPYDS